MSQHHDFLETDVVDDVDIDSPDQSDGGVLLHPSKHTRKNGDEKSSMDIPNIPYR